MPVFKREVEQGPAPVFPTVRVKVREEGHGKISTGKHDARDGEEYFAEGEEFEIGTDILDNLKADPAKRYYVEIMKPTKSA